MDHPMCRDCKTRHQLGVEFCPLYKEEPKTSVKKILKEVMPHSTVSARTAAGHDKAKPRPQVLVATEGGAKFDRNAYQREYMRKWRAGKSAGE